MKWWKWLTVALLLYTVIAGFLLPVPDLHILNESIRNLYFHVPMWFGMIILFFVSLVFSIWALVISGKGGNTAAEAMQLSHERSIIDIKAVEFVNAGLLCGVLGLATGSIWARFTWGDWWSGDVKQNTSAILLLFYFAYIVLRSAIPDPAKRAKVSAVYNIFAAATIVPLLFVIPRMTASLHPGAEGNPAFSSYDLNDQMRLVFYPAVLGWTLLGVWVARQRIILREIELKILEDVQIPAGNNDLLDDLPVGAGTSAGGKA